MSTIWLVEVFVGGIKYDYPWEWVPCVTRKSRQAARDYVCEGNFNTRTRVVKCEKCKNKQQIDKEATVWVCEQRIDNAYIPQGAAYTRSRGRSILKYLRMLYPLDKLRIAKYSRV